MIKPLALTATVAILTAACSLVADVGQFDNATAAHDDAASEPDGEVADGSLLPEADGAAEGASPIDARDPADAAGVEDTSVSDLDGGDAAAASSDGGDGAVIELDAADSAAPVQDAGNDAAALTWCAAHESATTLDCHDFDEGNPAPTGFSSNYYSSIFAAVTSTDYVPGSAPSSLLLSSPSLDAGGPSANEQFNDLVAYHGKLDLTFSVKIVNFQATSGDVSLFRISYKNTDWSMSLDYQNTSAELNESATLADGGTYNHAHLASQPTFTSWTTVDVLVDFVDHSIAMTYNGISIVASQAIESPTQTNPMLLVQVGLNFLGSPAKPMMIYYDNIVLSAPP
jgi:hypothetical protein